MLTVGEILIKARSEKKLSLEEIEKKIRIRKKFLIALEDNDWDRLPSLPYIKGSFNGLVTPEGRRSDFSFSVNCLLNIAIISSDLRPKNEL